MTALRYRPASSGGWLVIADGHRAFIVGPSGWHLADDAASVIGGELGFEATIDIVTRGGFASIPDFVLLEWNGDALRSLLRGPVTLSVTDGVGEHTQDGSGISTWTERSFTGATAARATVDGAASASGVAALTLRSGVAFLESCALEFSDEQASAPTARVAVPSGEVSETTVSSLPDETSVPATDTIVTTATPVAGIGGVIGETIVRSAPPAASDDRPGDHDGNTILSSDIAKLRSGRGPKARQATPEPARSMFLAFPDGSRERLDQPVLIGRSPSVSKVSGDRMPRLVTVGGGDQDISRNHAQFVVEGDTLVVTDLHSRNGTLVVLPGKSPQKLRAGEPTTVIVGTVVDLGGGITLTVGEE